MSGAAVVSWLSLTSKSLQLFKYGLDFHSRAVSAIRSSLAMLSLGSHTHELLLLLAVLSASHLCLRILGVFLDNMRNCEELWHSKAPQGNKPLKASRACRHSYTNPLVAKPFQALACSHGAMLLLQAAPWHHKQDLPALEM